MNLSELNAAFLHDTLSVSLPAFLPELSLCVSILLILCMRLFFRAGKVDAFYFALAGAFVGLWFSQPWLLADPSSLARTELFTGLIVYDAFTTFFRVFLFSFLLLFLVLTRLTGIPDLEDGPDIYVMVLGSALGMCLMASANHLLIVFLAVEMASVPSYALAGLMKGRKKASEAALKYAVYGAGAAGVMLYGLSLLCGVLGTAHLPTLASQLMVMLDPANAAQYGDRLFVLALAAMMVMVGLAFKLSAVPFHFWCPDVFEGASAEVNAFLSVASKAAAMGLLLRLCVGATSVITPAQPASASQTPVAAASTIHREHTGQHGHKGQREDAGRTNVLSAVSAAVEPATETSTVGSESISTSNSPQLEPARKYLANLIAVLAAVTCTFGNLAAYGQTNIKRLLAYSTIAHAGYMLMPVSAGLYMMQSDPAGAREAFASVLMYLLVYLFMNTGAFAVVAFVRNEVRSEEIADYAGLIRSCPALAICFSLILLSLVGLPPLMGFVVKFAAFAALGRASMWTLLIIGGLNTAVSLFYYLRVVKCMTLDAEPESRLPIALPLGSLSGAFVALLTAPLLVFIVSWEDLRTWSIHAIQQLLP